MRRSKIVRTGQRQNYAMNAQISPDLVIDFTKRHSHKSFYTLAQNKPFQISTTKNGIQITLPNGNYFPVNCRQIDKYLAFYHSSPSERKRKTTIYKDGLREASYMTRIFFEIEKEQALTRSEGSGLDDIDSVPLGTIAPDRTSFTISIVKRDPEVRKYIIERAKGCCEFCGAQGFLMPNGKRYLESHHIIFLASDGTDTVENVIALCAEHHRQAHFGANANELEKEFLKKIQNRV